MRWATVTQGARMLTVRVFFLLDPARISPSFGNSVLSFHHRLSEWWKFGLAVALIADEFRIYTRAPGNAPGPLALGQCCCRVGAWASGLAAAHARCLGSVVLLAGANPPCSSARRSSVRKVPENWVRARDEGKRQFGSAPRGLLTHPRWARTAVVRFVLCSAGSSDCGGSANSHVPSSPGMGLCTPAGRLARKQAYWASFTLILQRNVGGFLARRPGKVAQVAAG